MRLLFSRHSLGYQ